MTRLSSGHAGYKGKLPCLVLFLALMLVIPASFPAAADLRSQPVLHPQHRNMPLLPFLEYYIDESLSMDIEEASSPSLEGSYQPLSLDKLPRTEGIVWLRFILAPLPPDIKSPVYLLDMGQSVPGVPRLYDPARNELSGAVEWRENTPAQRNILLLPEQTSEPLLCFIRLDGLPGPWFDPVIRSPQDAAGNWGSLCRTGAILALAVVMLLCLMRGLSENGQWRIWTSLFVAAALCQALVGMPDMGDIFSLKGLAAVLLPGIALMLLPHVGRHLMRTPRTSRSIDIQLVLLSLPGAALALCPLVPGWEWLDRWLDLWPAGTILFVPTALAAWIMGLGGSGRFLLGSLIPPLFTGVAILGLDFGMPANLLASLPLWGIALSAMLIAVTKAPQAAPAENAPPVAEGKKPENDELLPNAVVPPPDLDHPLDDPNLRLVSRPGSENAESGTAFGTGDEDAVSDARVALEERELALRKPLDEIMRQGAALGECSLPPAVRIYAENMLAACRRMSGLITGHDSAGEKESQSPRAKSSVFNLQNVMRRAHNAVATDAENSGISLSWYMPPNICQNYIGNGERLEETLRMLLESSARAANGGSVNLSVKEVSEPGESGRLLFTIVDNGRGYPPGDRSGLALVKVWEMIGACDGSLGVEAGPNGASIAFSARFDPAPKDQAEEDEVDLPHVVLACDETFRRRELVCMLDNLPFHICEAQGMREALECQKKNPGPLLIASGGLARPSAADLVAEFKEIALGAGFTECHVLAITPDDSQWGLLKPSGFTHAMLSPVDPDILRETVENLARQSVLSRIPPAQSPVPPVEQEEPAEVSLPEDAESEAGENYEKGRVEEAKNSPLPEPPLEKEPEKESPVHVAGGMETGEELANGTIRPLDMDIDDFAQAFECPNWLDGEDVKPQGREATETFASGADAGQAARQPEQNASGGMEPEAGKEEENGGSQLSTVDSSHSARAVEDGIDSGRTSAPIAMGNGGEDESASQKDGESLVDFIVGVESDVQPPVKSDVSAEYLMAKENAKIALAATKRSKTVSDFVNSSVDLVTRTFTNTLSRQREEKRSLEKPVVPPVKPPVSKPAINVPATENMVAKPPAARDERRLDPEIMELVRTLDKAMADAFAAHEAGDAHRVVECTGIIVRETQAYGLRNLSQMAQCVMRAGEAGDLPAIRDLLPELGNAVERNRITLTHTK